MIQTSCNCGDKNCKNSVWFYEEAGKGMMNVVGANIEGEQLLYLNKASLNNIKDRIDKVINEIEKYEMGHKPAYTEKDERLKA